MTESINHLSDNFYRSPETARQIMTLKHWQETAEATQCRILANGESRELYTKHMGGGMYEVRCRLTYLMGNKSKRG